MIKKGLLLLLALVLLALPVVGRWLYYHEGRYEPAQVARPDLDGIEAPTAQVESFVDRFAASEAGVILVDMAHDNRFVPADMAVLQARLAARAQSLEPVVDSQDLASQLRYARALIVVSPGWDWTAREIDQVQDFVAKGGRLLLVTDPTRYGVVFDEYDTPVIDDDVLHINDLAARFGLLFQADYLYNTTDNAGNFRNIKLTDFAEDDLTAGLEQVVFFAAHSIVSDEPGLIVTGGETRSSESARAEPLSVAVLAAEGGVLALGDLTFFSEPHNALYDNDRWIANVADWLSGAQREYELTDFPYFFARQTDLVFVGDPLWDSDLLKAGSALQDLFVEADRELLVQEAEDGEADTLFFGLYEAADEVEPYLEEAGVTLWLSPTGDLEEGGTALAAPRVTATSVISPPLQNLIEIESIGQMVVTGTSLLLLQADGGRQVMVALADSGAGLDDAVQRLSSGAMEGCLFHQVVSGTSTLVLCPTGEVAPGGGEGGWESEPERGSDSGEGEAGPADGEPPPSEEPLSGSILIVALDQGQPRYTGLTSVEDYWAILSEGYDLTSWSVTQDGMPTVDDMLGFDLVIWTAGDYESSLGDEESDLLFELVLEGIPIVLSGAFVSDSETEAVQRDIQVHEADHPLAADFEADEVIEFVAPPWGGDLETRVLEPLDGEEGSTVPFVRGPGSEEAGAPSIFVMSDETTDVRIVFIGFPVYLLPEKAKTTLVLNMAHWLLAP